MDVEVSIDDSTIVVVVNATQVFPSKTDGHVEIRFTIPHAWELREKIAEKLRAITTRDLLRGRGS